MSTATAAHLASLPMFIAGRPVVSRGRSEQLYNPATGEPTALFHHSTPEEINQAVEAAAKAFPSWSATPVLQRCRVLFHFHHELEAHADELIALITEENGKT